MGNQQSELKGSLDKLVAYKNKPQELKDELSQFVQVCPLDQPLAIKLDKKVFDIIYALFKSEVADTTTSPFDLNTILQAIQRFLKIRMFYIQLPKCDMTPFVEVLRSDDPIQVMAAVNMVSYMVCAQVVPEPGKEKEWKWEEAEAAVKYSFFENKGYDALCQVLIKFCRTDHTNIVNKVLDILSLDLVDHIHTSRFHVVQRILKYLTPMAETLLDLSVQANVTTRAYTLILLSGFMLNSPLEQVTALQNKALRDGYLLWYILYSIDAEGINADHPYRNLYNKNLTQLARNLLGLLCSGHKMNTNVVLSIVPPALVGNIEDPVQARSKLQGAKRQERMQLQSTLWAAFNSGAITRINLDALFSNLDDEVKLPHIVWVNRMKAEVLDCVRMEIENLAVTRQIDKNAAFDFEAFEVQHSYLDKYCRVGNFYVSILIPALQNRNSGYTLKPELMQELLSALFQRAVIEDDPSWKLACMGAISTLYERYPEHFKELLTIPYYIYLLDKRRVEPIWRDHILRFMQTVFREPINARRFVTFNGVPALLHHISRVHSVENAQDFTGDLESVPSIAPRQALPSAPTLEDGSALTDGAAAAAGSTASSPKRGSVANANGAMSSSSNGGVAAGADASGGAVGAAGAAGATADGSVAAPAPAAPAAGGAAPPVAAAIPVAKAVTDPATQASPAKPPTASTTTPTTPATPATTASTASTTIPAPPATPARPPALALGAQLAASEPFKVNGVVRNVVGPLGPRPKTVAEEQWDWSEEKENLVDGLPPVFPPEEVCARSIRLLRILAFGGAKLRRQITTPQTVATLVRMIAAPVHEARDDAIRLLLDLIDTSPHVVPFLQPTGLFLFVLHASRWPITPNLVKLVDLAHRSQAVDYVPKGKSAFFPYLPAPVVRLLIDEGAEAFLTLLERDSLRPDIIWNTSMRAHMLDTVQQRVRAYFASLEGDFDSLEPPSDLNASITYPQLDAELFIGGVYLQPLNQVGEANIADVQLTNPDKVLNELAKALASKRYAGAQMISLIMATGICATRYPDAVAAREFKEFAPLLALLDPEEASKSNVLAKQPAELRYDLMYRASQALNALLQIVGANAQTCFEAKGADLLSRAIQQLMMLDLTQPLVSASLTHVLASLSLMCSNYAPSLKQLEHDEAVFANLQRLLSVSTANTYPQFTIRACEALAAFGRNDRLLEAIVRSGVALLAIRLSVFFGVDASAEAGKAAASGDEAAAAALEEVGRVQRAVRVAAARILSVLKERGNKRIQQTFQALLGPDVFNAAENPQTFLVVSDGTTLARRERLQAYVLPQLDAIASSSPSEWVEYMRDSIKFKALTAEAASA